MDGYTLYNEYLLCVAKGLLQRRYFFMKKLKKQFQDSWNNLKNLKVLVATAMYLAAAVILGFLFTIQLTDFIKIGFSSIPNELTALFFGPVVGGIMGGTADILKFIVKPTGAYFFGFTLNAIIGPMIYGVILYHKPFSFWRIFIAKLIVALVVNLLLGTYWLSILYGKGFLALLPARFIKQVITVPIDSILFYFVAKGLIRTRVLERILE